MKIFTPEIIDAILLTVELAAASTLILLTIATPIGWVLARSKSWWREPVNALISMPMVLPPTVLGFYLLVVLGPDGPGGFLASFVGLRTLAFTFGGLVFGSVAFSLPVVVQPIRNAFEAMGARPMEAAATLRLSPAKAFFKVALPLARPGLLTGAILGFAHTVGEFGVVLMIGGNMPGKTKVLSIAIFDLVESGHMSEAHVLSAVMVAFAFCAILTMTAINRTAQWAGQ